MAGGGRPSPQPLFPGPLLQQIPAAGPAIRAGTDDLDDGKGGGEKVEHFGFAQPPGVRVSALFGQFVKGVEMKVTAGCEISGNPLRIAKTSITWNGVKTADVQNIARMG